jgi:hypothetical protein|tara:strand:- start:1140 stop:1304 length:165 start_codon:yes stop_codon:yes gene_type:complete
MPEPTPRTPEFDIGSPDLFEFDSCPTRIWVNLLTTSVIASLELLGIHRELPLQP